MSVKNNNELLNFILGYYNTKKEFDQAQEEFEQAKKNFYLKMEEYFKDENIDKSIVFECEGYSEGSTLEVNRVQKSNVVFDANKVEKKLGKEISKDVITKKYEIVDMFGLIAYLKECGVDPNTFKSFLNISKTVDVKEIERLEELGKVSLEQLKGCYSVKMQKPYFTVRMKRGQNDGAKEW